MQLDDSCHCHREKITLNFIPNIKKNRTKMLNNSLKDLLKMQNTIEKVIIERTKAYFSFHEFVNFTVLSILFVNITKILLTLESCIRCEVLVGVEFKELVN
jgi:hypothetical protein